MLRRQPGQDIAHLHSQCRVASGRQVIKLVRYGALRLTSHPDRLPDRDRPYPTEKCGRFAKLTQPAQDDHQCLLDGVGRVLQRDRPAPSSDRLGDGVEHVVHRQHVTALRRPDRAYQDVIDTTATVGYGHAAERTGGV